jgi:very-short-patch-repair endonuclease
LQEREVVKLNHSQEILNRCSALRTAQTHAESKLWKRLRNRQLDGLKFRRQHPVGPYILDFYCHEAKLAIELDGSGHQEPEQADYDDNRSAELQSMGIRTVRFWNNEVMENLEGVLESIRETLTHGSSQSG